MHTLKVKPHFTPRPKLERLPKGKAVTIVIGMRCNDGLLIAADTEETADFRRSVSKLSVCMCSTPETHKAPDFFDGPFQCLIIGGAGRSDHIDAVSQLLQDEMSGKADTDLEKRFGRVVAEYYREHVLCWPSEQERSDNDFALIIGVSLPRLPLPPNIHLWMTSQTVLRSVNRDAIGSGCSYARSLMDTFVRPLYGKVAVTLTAIQIIQKVKQHMPYCGKNTQIQWLPNRGHAIPVSAIVIEKTEKLFQQYENSQVEHFLSMITEAEDWPGESIVARDFGKSFLDFQKDFTELRHEIEAEFSARLK